MSNDLNQCNFIGRLGRDPETRYLPDGKAVTNFSIAVGSSWKDKSGEKQESVEWVRISCFGKLAEICDEWLQKGQQVFISGAMKTRKWEDKDGQDKYTTEVIADAMQMLGGKPDGARQEESKPAKSDDKYNVTKQSAKFDDFESDIPF